MSQRYLLPCKCGGATPIDTSQAGLAVRCEQCGSETVAPTYRGVVALERAPDDAKQSPSLPWGPRQAIAFLGLSLALPALSAAVVLWLTYPAFPDLAETAEQQSQVRQQIDDLGLSESIELWQSLRQGLDADGEAPVVMAWKERSAWYDAWITGTLVVAGLGAALAGIGWLVIKDPPRA